MLEVLLPSSAPASLAAIIFTAALPLSAHAAPSADELPETCYLFAHFYVNGDSGLHLAWSPDGLDWEMLDDPDANGYIVPSVGESKIMRDPSLLRGPDGTFHMVWTTSWDGKTIGYASSPDLIHWSGQKAIPVMAHEPDAQNCWAPDVHYIPETEEYLILWSTTIPGRFPETAMSNRRPERNHRIYSTTTKDFETFMPTRLFYDGGFNVIDAIMAPAGNGEWLMFVKDEALSPVTQKNIKMVRAATPYGPFSAPSEKITGDYWAEGPCPIKIGDAWYVYFDKHMLDAYGVVRSTDLDHWEDISEQGSFPPHARHGTVLAVPREVVLKLMEKRAK